MRRGTASRVAWRDTAGKPLSIFRLERIVMAHVAGFPAACFGGSAGLGVMGP